MKTYYILKPKNIVVMGGLGSGLIVANIIDLLPNMKLFGFLNDRYPIGTNLGMFKKIPVIGNSKDVHKFIKNEDTYVVLAYKTMKKEKEMWEKYIDMGIPREKFINIIHPLAIIPDGYCSMGRGIIMAAGSQLSVDTVISDNCILFANSFIGHDSRLDKYVTVANNASIGAEVHIGKAVHIGSNCTIKQGVSIGDYSLIGMGSLILDDVPENTIVMNEHRNVVIRR